MLVTLTTMLFIIEQYIEPTIHNSIQPMMTMVRWDVWGAQRKGWTVLWVLQGQVRLHAALRGMVGSR